MPESILTWDKLKVGDIITNGFSLTSMVIEIYNSNTDYHIFAGTHWIPDWELEGWTKIVS